MPKTNPIDANANKPVPANIDAEKSVLAACLLNAEILEEILLKLKPEDFFRPAHRVIFEAVASLNARRIPVDQISLADTLKASNQLEAVGGPAYIIELAEAEGMRAHALAVKVRK